MPQPTLLSGYSNDGLGSMKYVYRIGVHEITETDYDFGVQVTLYSCKRGVVI